MAFDGIITSAMVKELQDRITLGKIEKVYQPEADELVFHIHTKNGNVKLYASCASADPRVHFIEASLPNPPAPLPFCMLLRKHLQGGRIVEVAQKDAERIIEISLETMSELGFTLSKKLIFEIMGKHSNIILVDMTSGKVIDSIKRVSIDVNRVRQILPGKVYSYPPAQDKIPFSLIDEETLSAICGDSKVFLARIGGISPAVARELAASPNPWETLQGIRQSIEHGDFIPHIYTDKNGAPQEFHIASLSEYENGASREDYPTLSLCLSDYYARKTSSNRVRQKRTTCSEPYPVC